MSQTERLHGEGTEIFENKVRNLAGKIWLDTGSTHGHDVPDWLKARTQIQEESLSEAIQFEAEGRKLTSILKGQTTVTVGNSIGMSKSEIREYGAGFKGQRTPFDWEKHSEVKKDSELEKPENILLDEIAELGERVKKLEGSGKDSQEAQSSEATSKGNLSSLLKDRYDNIYDKDEIAAAKKRAEKDAFEEKWEAGRKDREKAKREVAEVKNPQKKKSEISEGQEEIIARLKQINIDREEGKFKKEVEQNKEEPIAKPAAAEPSKTSAGKTETKQQPEVKIGPATWNDQPVKITGYAGNLDGKDYIHIEGTSAIIPLDEIEYPKEELREQLKKQPEKAAQEAESAGKSSTAKKKTEEETPKSGDGAKDKESPEMKTMREKEEKRRKLEKECKEKLDAAEKKGREEGEKEGREKLLHEIEEKKNRNIFRRFGKFIKRHKKVIIAGAIGAAIVAATWATMQSLSLYLPWNVPITTINNFIDGVRIP